MKEKHDLDRRVQKTRQMLSKALFELIAERSYESITVQDIAEQANIGRATFYLHYRDKEQLLEASLHQLYRELIASAEIQASYSTRALSVHIFRHVAQHQYLYQALLSESGPPMSITHLSQGIAKLIQHDLMQPLVAKHPPAADLTLVATHCAGSLLALVQWWLKHNLTPSAEEMGDQFWRLIHLGLDSVLGIDKSTCQDT